MEYYPTTYRPDHLFDISRIRTVLLTFYAVSERLSGTSIFEYAYIAKDPGNTILTANIVMGSHQSLLFLAEAINTGQSTHSRPPYIPRRTLEGCVIDVYTQKSRHLKVLAGASPYVRV